MARISFARLDEAVNKFAKAVVKDARGNLTREHANATRSLWSSIGYRWRDGTLSFFMSLYGAFLDKGVSGTGQLHYRNGKSMPVAYNKSEGRPEYRFKSSKKAIGGDLSNWLKLKNVPMSAEFPIRRSIHARGIRPRRFFTYAFARNYKKFDDVIGKALTDDINDYLDDVLKQ